MKQRKDGRWQKTITINGKKLFFYSNAKTERQAEQEIFRKVVEFKEKKEAGETVTEVAEEWAKKHYKNIVYSTAYRYDIYKNRFLKEFGNEYIKQITATNIDSFLFKMVQEGYTTKTIKDQLSVIKMIFRYAALYDKTSEDVSFRVSLPKGADSQKREALTNQEIDIVNSSIDCTFGFLAYFLLYTGLRKGELLALRWKDVDLKNQILHISCSVDFISNEPYIKTPKTKAGIRDVIIPDCLADKLKDKKTKNPEDFVFNQKGKLINKSYFTRQWKKYLDETGLNFTAHQLRHTYATLLFEAEISERDAQFLMGHSDIKVTQNIYTHIRKSRSAVTSNKLNTYLKSISSQNPENP